MRLNISHGRLVWALTGSVVLALCCFYLFKTAAVRVIAQSEAHTTPFLLQRDVYIYSNNPSGELHGKMNVARRSDGTTVDIVSVGPLARGLYVRGINFLDGSSVSVADFLKVKTTWPGSERRAAYFKARTLDPPRNCVLALRETLAAEGKTLLGQKVVVVTAVLTLPQRPLLTIWRAPDLGCAELQYQSEGAQPDGSYKLVSQVRAVSLRLGEPDPALFDDGRDYAEVRPSQRESQIGAFLGETTVGEDIQKSRDIQDRAYDESWARRR